LSSYEGYRPSLWTRCWSVSARTGSSQPYQNWSSHCRYSLSTYTHTQMLQLINEHRQAWLLCTSYNCVPQPVWHPQNYQWKCHGCVVL
jgi:hypothetical protein